MSRGRGRGRGRGSGGALGDRTFEAIPVLEPTTFPQIDISIPLHPLEAEEFDIQFKDRILSYWKSSAFFIDIQTHEKRIERYSDKYAPVIEKRQKLEDVPTTLSMFPIELHSKKKTVVKSKMETKDVFSVFEKIVNKKEPKEGETPDETEEPEEELLEMDDEDEENDYGESYFDNGEGDGLSDDGDEDGGVY